MKNNITPLIGMISLFIWTLVSVNACYSDNSLNESFIKAVDQKQYQLMDELLSKGADINSSFLDGKYTALSSAASTGDLKLVKYLIKKGADIKGNELFPNSPIFLAISGNHIDIVSLLFDEGVDPNYAWPGKDEGTLLISAIQLGYLGIVKLIVERGADINFTGNGDYSPLYRSIINDHFKIFEFLLIHGAKLNKSDKEALNTLKWKSIKGSSKYLEKLEM